MRDDRPLLPLLLAALALAVGAPRQDGAQGAAAAPSPSPRPAWTRRRIVDLYSRIAHRAHLRGAATPTTTWRGRSKVKPLTADGMPEVLGRLPRLDRSDPARHLLRRRSGVQGQAARAGGGRTMCTPRSASSTRSNKSPLVAGITGDRTSSAWPRCASEAHQGQRSRSTTTSRSTGLRALDRYTLRVQARRTARRASSKRLARQRPVRRGGARGRSSSTATRSTAIRWAPGPFRLDAAGGAARRSCSSATRTTARCSTTPSRRADDAEGQAMLAQVQGPAPADGRSRCEIAIIEQSQPRWLSFLNGEVDALVTTPAACRRTSAIAMPGGKVAPNLAKRGIRGCAQPQSRLGACSTSTWKTRWSAATRPTRSRCAARISLAMTTSTREIAHTSAAAGDPAQSPVLPHTVGLRPRVQERE